jgi:hypothetical protein
VLVERKKTEKKTERKKRKKEKKDRKKERKERERRREEFFFCCYSCPCDPSLLLLSDFVCVQARVSSMY